MYEWYILATVIVAFTGYLFTYWSNLRNARHQAELELVNRRLNKFYGPLYIIVRTTDIAYQEHLSKQRNQIHEPHRKLSTKEREDYRAWVMGVYSPMAEKLSELILNGAHLIREEKMPLALLNLIAHVSVTKALIYKLETGDYSELNPTIDYPFKEIMAYAEKSYSELKAQQLKLIGILDIKW